MQYKYINYKNNIKKITNKDKLFIGDYIIDPYQNCEFGCKYCDSSFDKIIYIKNDFLNKIKKEIKNISKGRIIIGSVVDPYQKIENKLKITRSLLKILKNNHLKVHILTKSDLILRDIDILLKMEKVNVTISIISLKDNVLNIFEKNVPSTNNRFKVIEKLSNYDIKTGLAVIPILPFIIEDEIEDIIRSSIEYKSEYLLFKFLELKGFQKNIFYDNLKVLNSDLLNKYINLYNNRYLPDKKYMNRIRYKISKYCKIYNIPNNILSI